MLRALCHQVLLEFDTRPTRHAPYQMIDFDIHEDSEPQRVRPRRRRSSKKRVSFGYRQFLDVKENLVNVERITPLPKATPPAKRVQRAVLARLGGAKARLFSAVTPDARRWRRQEKRDAAAAAKERRRSEPVDARTKPRACCAPPPPSPSPPPPPRVDVPSPATPAPEPAKASPPRVDVQLPSPPLVDDLRLSPPPETPLPSRVERPAPEPAEVSRLDEATPAPESPAGGSRADEAMPAEKSAALAAHERLRRAKAGLEAVAGRPRRPAPDAPRIDAVAELLMACSCAPDAVGEPGDAYEEFLELEASESPGPVAARRVFTPSPPPRRRGGDSDPRGKTS